MIAATPLCLHAVATTPAGLMELIRSYCSIRIGHPVLAKGMAPALHVSGPAQRSLLSTEAPLLDRHYPVYRKDVLAFAYECCKANGGAAGVDGQTFEDIEAYGKEQWLDAALGREHQPPLGGRSSATLVEEEEPIRLTSVEYATRMPPGH